MDGRIVDNAALSSEYEKPLERIGGKGVIAGKRGRRVGSRASWLHARDGDRQLLQPADRLVAQPRPQPVQQMTQRFGLSKARLRLSERRPFDYTGERK